MVFLDIVKKVAFFQPRQSDSSGILSIPHASDGVARDLLHASLDTAIDARLQV